MSEQIEFNMDKEYSLRVAPALVEIDLSTYEEFELAHPYDEKLAAFAAEQRRRNERDILESEFCLDEDDMPDPDAATVEAWAEETRIVMESEFIAD